MSVTPRRQHGGVIESQHISTTYVGIDANGARDDYTDMLDEFRCCDTDRIAAARAEAVREQRRWRLRELAATRVLDERGRVDDSLAGVDGVSTQQVRETLATARALADLPHVAAAAADGRLSDAQLTQVVRVCEATDPADEAAWAAAALAWSPRDLAQKAREARTPTLEDATTRRAARELRWWWNRHTGMLDGRFSLPDVDGAVVENVLTELAERMRPAKGRAWDSREHRAADALVEVCRSWTDRDHDAPTSRTRAHLVVQVPLSGPATVAGVPLPDAMVERLRAGARVEPVLVDGAGEAVAVGRCDIALSEKTRRVIRQRDGHCRWPGCDRRMGLEVHHLWPRSWGGTDDLWNLATVCTVHHDRLAPQGTVLLLGNPHDPAGLTLVARDDLPAMARLAADGARAGP